MSRKVIDTQQLINYLSATTSTYKEISDFILENSQEVYLEWDEGSIYEVLNDADRENEYETLTPAQKTRILELFTDWTISFGLSELEKSLLEAVDCILIEHNMSTR